MKTQFFDIEDLKTKSFDFWCSLLRSEVDNERLGNIWFAARCRLYRVSFSYFHCAYTAEFYYFRSRINFNRRYSTSLVELFDKVYDLLND